jgi:hypothetical protein
MKHTAIALIVIVAVATVAATYLPSPVRGIPGDFTYAFGPMVRSRGDAFLSKSPSNCLDQHIETTTAMLLSDGRDGEDEEEGKGEKDAGDDKKDDDTGPDRIWGAVKLG